MTKLFSKDGISGRAMSELSCEKALQIGRALALIFQNRTGRRAKAVIGRDTRLSGELLTVSLAAGFCSAGSDAHILGVVPTPAVSYLVQKYSADVGVMLTASHNTYEFNGIKLFDSRGFDMPEDIIAEIARLVDDAPDEARLSGGDQIGALVTEKNAEWDYVRGLIKQIDGDLSRMRIAIDCANGSACGTAEKFFRGIGAGVSLINNTPDGRNINRECGTADLAPLQKYVVENRCHAGIAFDGDAGRCIMVDEKGQILDGDRITAVLAYAMKSSQKLSANTVVVPQSTNLGFFRWAKENGIVVATASGYGSKHLIERMQVGDYNLGGSPSGHIVLLDRARTADGQLAAAKVLEILARSGRKMSDLAGIYEPYPQMIINLQLRPEYAGHWQDVPAISEMIEFCQQKLEGDGRVFVRQSSTSPILRIIAEGRDKDVVWQYAQAIAKTVRDHAGYPEE